MMRLWRTRSCLESNVTCRSGASKVGHLKRPFSVGVVDVVLGSDSAFLEFENARERELLPNEGEGRSGMYFRRLFRIAVGPDEARRRPPSPALFKKDLVIDCLEIWGCPWDEDF